MSDYTLTESICNEPDKWVIKGEFLINKEQRPSVYVGGGLFQCEASLWEVGIRYYSYSWRDRFKLWKAYKCWLKQQKECK